MTEDLMDLYYPTENQLQLLKRLIKKYKLLYKCDSDPILVYTYWVKSNQIYGYSADDFPNLTRVSFKEMITAIIKQNEITDNKQ